MEARARGEIARASPLALPAALTAARPAPHGRIRACALIHSSPLLMHFASQHLRTAPAARHLCLRTSDLIKKCSVASCAQEPAAMATAKLVVIEF